MRACLEQLAAISPELDLAAVSPRASLTEELMLDSFLLASLVERLDQAFPGVDMTQWFMRATRGGHDTLDDLVTFLLEANARFGEGGRP